MRADSQLSLLVDDSPRWSLQDLSSMVVGFWAAGERLVDIGGRLLPANVWFHFASDNTAVLSMRYRDQDRASATFGRWSITAEGGLLVAEFGKTVIGAPLVIQDDSAEIICWAGEVLHRLPQDLPTEEPGTQPVCPQAELSTSAGQLLCLGPGIASQRHTPDRHQVARDRPG